MQLQCGDFFNLEIASSTARRTHIFAPFRPPAAKCNENQRKIDK